MKTLTDGFDVEAFRQVLRERQAEAERFVAEKERQKQEIISNHQPVSLELPDWYIVTPKHQNIIDGINFAFQSESDYHLLFIGKVGCGKTMLSDMVMGQTAGYLDYQFSKFVSYKIEPKLYIERVIANMNCRQVDVDWFWTAENLIIDDLGNEKDHPTWHQQIASDLEEHYKAIDKGKCKHSIITTNLKVQKKDSKGNDNLQSIQGYYGDRVLDRLLEVYTLCYFDDKSYRVKQIKRIN